MGLLGPLTAHRAYYYCGRCGHGSCPFDTQAALSGRHLTLAAEEIVRLTGLLTDSFAEAAQKILPRLTGQHFGPPTVRRVTEEVGGQLGDWLEQECTFGPSCCWEWRRDAAGRRVAYVSIDATAVPRQGPGARKAEARMPYVAMVYNPPVKEEEEGEKGGEGNAAASRRPRATAEKARTQMRARYLAGLLTLPLLGSLLRRQGAQVGMEAAEQWVGLSDGGSGLGEFPRENLNRADLAVILDFYHPASRLEGLARLWHEGDEAAARSQARQWCQALKEDGGGCLLARLRALPPPRRGDREV